MLRGIDYIVKVDPSVTKLDSFQADYRTKGDFDVSTFSTKDGVMAAVASGRIGKTNAIIKMDDLQILRTLVEQAKAKLDASRGTQ